jgi:hypothetical protein
MVDVVLGEEAGDQIRGTAVPRGSKFYCLSFCGSFLIFLTCPGGITAQRHYLLNRMASLAREN